MQEQIKIILKYNKSYIKQKQSFVNWLEANFTTILELSKSWNKSACIGSGYGSIDFENLTHEEAIKVMLAFPGKWDKVYNETTINYRMQHPDGFILSLWMSSPPPNCKIVEEVVNVPEKVTVVAAHKKLVRKIVCNEPTTIPSVSAVL
jgi:hypothetical protein